MYKVMIVDDDYPVLEFLSEEVEWKALGLQLQSIHENGESALSHALTEMPDILITDIGMPKMDGLELTKKMKERNSSLQVAILSCHNEFKYAQHALALKVEDYILKETLDPEDLSGILLGYKERLKEKHLKVKREMSLRKQLTKNSELAKDNFFQQIIYQPTLSNQGWKHLGDGLGFRLEEKDYLPVLCVIDNYLLAKQYFATENTIQFAMNNVMGEIIDNNDTIYFNFESNRLFILFPMSTSLKIDNYNHITDVLKQIQESFIECLGIPVSFLIGNKVKPSSFQAGLTDLLTADHQLFYMDHHSIAIRLKEREISIENLFLFYNKAAVEFRNLIFANEIEAVGLVVSKWTVFIKQHNFAPSIVKDWVLKILIELTMKIKSLHPFRSNDEVKIMHHEIIKIDTLNELNSWLISYLESAILHISEGVGQTNHKEILRARIYINKNIESKLSLVDVANEVYLNTSYFSRLFRQEIGVTFIEYVTNLKIDRAKELLDQTDYKLGEICGKLGYDNLSYFIKIFRDSVGSTPNEYRKNNRLEMWK